MGPEGGYRLGAGSELPPLLFDDDQAIAVAVALQTAPAAGAGIEEGAIRALTTVRQVMPSRLRHRLDALEVTAVPSRPGQRRRRHGRPPTSWSHSPAAVRAREVLRFDYADPRRRARTPSPSHRAASEPHHLVTSHGRWYLVGLGPPA